MFTIEVKQDEGVLKNWVGKAENALQQSKKEKILAKVDLDVKKIVSNAIVIKSGDSVSIRTSSKPVEGSKVKGEQNIEIKIRAIVLKDINKTITGINDAWGSK